MTDHVHEAWWLIETKVAPRTLYFAGHQKQSDGRLTMHMVDDASKAARFPDEWGAKYSLAAMMGVKVKEPMWPLQAMKFGYSVAEHIFDYTPRGVPAVEASSKLTCPKCGGAGWLWWKELDNYSGPAIQTGVDDTRYPCDACGAPPTDGAKHG